MEQQWVNPEDLVNPLPKVKSSKAKFRNWLTRYTEAVLYRKSAQMKDLLDEAVHEDYL